MLGAHIHCDRGKVLEYRDMTRAYLLKKDRGRTAGLLVQHVQAAFSQCAQCGGLPMRTVRGNSRVDNDGAEGSMGSPAPHDPAACGWWLRVVPRVREAGSAFGRKVVGGSERAK